MYKDPLIIGNEQFYTYKETLRKRNIADKDKPEDEGEVLFRGRGMMLYAFATGVVCYAIEGLDFYFRYYPETGQKEIVYNFELIWITRKGYEVSMKGGREIVFFDEEVEHLLTDKPYHCFLTEDYVIIEPRKGLNLFLPHRLYYSGLREYYEDKELKRIVWDWFISKHIPPVYHMYWVIPEPFSMEKIRERLVYLRSGSNIPQKTLNRAYELFQVLRYYGIYESDDISKLLFSLYKCFEINYGMHMSEANIDSKKFNDCLKKFAKIPKNEMSELLKEAQEALYRDSENIKEDPYDDYIGHNGGYIGQFSVYKGVIGEVKTSSVGYINKAGELRVNYSIYKGQVYYRIESGEYVIEWPDDENILNEFLDEVERRFKLIGCKVVVLHKGQIVREK